MDEILQQELDKAKRFFETQGKNDHAYYKLYSIKYVDSSYGKDDLRTKNFSSASLNESIEMLERDMRSVGDISKEFFYLKHYTTPNDPQPIGIPLKNPFFNPNNHKGSMSANNGINGFGGLNAISGGVLDLMREHYASVGSLKEELIKMQHKIELDEKNRQLEEAENSRRGKFDAINDFFETPIGTQLGQVLLLMVQKQMMGGNIQPNLQQQQVKQQQMEQEHEPELRHDNSNPEQENQLNKVHNAMANLESVFGKDSINALEQLSIYCKENPDMAYQLFQQKKRQP